MQHPSFLAAYWFGHGEGRSQVGKRIAERYPGLSRDERSESMDTGRQMLRSAARMSHGSGTDRVSDYDVPCLGSGNQLSVVSTVEWQNDSGQWQEATVLLGGSLMDKISDLWDRAREWAKGRTDPNATPRGATGPDVVRDQPMTITFERAWCI